jgi:uncharacterized repeat protein (TIGR03803 family)
MMHRLKTVSWWILGSFLFCLTMTSGATAQTFTTLLNFSATNGANPYLMSLVQGTDGNFYGTTSDGGTDDPPNNDGTVFKITPAGMLTAIYSFCAQTGCTDGEHPAAGLVQATDGNFYGTTTYGGANGGGTVFKITRAGALTTLYSFCAVLLNGFCMDGSGPYAGLVLATNGNLYGTTEVGGTNDHGTVFQITPTGILTTLHSFVSTDGEYPLATLIQTTNGNLYGTTWQGGADDYGTVFEVTPTTGALTTVHSFDGADGSEPYAALMQARNGNLYGTTLSGGTDNSGTVFEITPTTGTLTTLHSFDGADGYEPSAALVQAANGNFYGTTSGYGGSSGYGTVFQITTEGALTTLYNFNGTDGIYPFGGLMQATNGKFYGTTYQEGADCCGTVFSLSVSGLGPFVEMLPASGKVGISVKILGTNLTGATSVEFNGTLATFKVASSSEITTTVPVGATTGTVTVTTPQGTLSSNVPYRVQ